MRFLLGFLIAAASLFGGDLTGIWIGQVPGRTGEMQDIAFKITQTGSTISGKLYGDYRSEPITEGSVTGGRISFLVVATEQNGNQINRTRLRFTGTLENGELALVREREGSTNAGNGGGVQFKGSTTQALRLKRLL